MDPKMVVKILFLVAYFCFAELDGTEGHRLSCSYHQFRCFNGKCISRNYFCDRDNDCEDNSDERYCDINGLETSCPVEEGSQWLLCANNRRCIPSVWKCDGRADCTDVSDEFSCTDGSGEFSSRDEFPTTVLPNDEFLTVLPNDEFSTVLPNDEFSTVLPNDERKTAIKYFPGVQPAVRKLSQDFLHTRQDSRSVNKWGPHLQRTAVALFLTDSRFFEVGNKTGDEIAYELSLQLTVKLALKKRVATSDLSLFINALTVACINPRDFFGVDLVRELRRRVDRSNYTNPFSLLTLCNANDAMKPEDVIKIKAAFDSHLRPLWTDTQALATMAMACVSSRANVDVKEEMLSAMVDELKRKQLRNGTIDSLKTTAIVVQALLSTNSYLTDFDLDGAIKYVLRGINTTKISLLDMYYILPMLNSMSIVNISSDHCIHPVVTELEVLKNLLENTEERLEVRVSVCFGNDMDFVRTWKLKVPANYNFYHVLENIGSLEPAYKAHYSVSNNKKPYVVGMSNFFNDAEKGMFWFIYTQNLKNTTQPKLVEESPVDIQFKEEEELILWYRSGTWADSEINISPPA